MARTKSSDEDTTETGAPQYGPKEIDAAALRAYVAFGATLGFKNLKGEDLPKWEDLPKVGQDAIRNAVFAVLTGG